MHHHPARMKGRRSEEPMRGFIPPSATSEPPPRWAQHRGFSLLIYARVVTQAAFDKRLTHFDVRVLLAFAGTVDPNKLVTDYSAVQLTQDLATHRTSIVRSMGRLREAGYIVPVGWSSRHARVYKVPISPPPVAAGAHVTTGAHVTPGEQSEGDTPGAHVTLGQPQHVTLGAHSLRSSNDTTEFVDTGEVADGRQVDRLSDWWNLDLLESDLEAGTLLVEYGRAHGYARDLGGRKDALQAQYAAFLAHLEGIAWPDAPTRRMFAAWLLEKAEARSQLSPGPSEKIAPVEPEKPKEPAVTPGAHVTPGAPPADDDLEIPDFLDRRPKPPNLAPDEKPKRPRISVTPSAAAWRPAWVKVLDAIIAAHGWHEAHKWFDLLTLFEHEGRAFIMFNSDDGARIASEKFGATIRATWMAELSGVEIVAGYMCHRKRWHVVQWQQEAA